MKVVFSPSVSKGNTYVSIIQSLLSVKGVKVISLNVFFKAFIRHKNVRIIHLNWFENLTGKNTLYNAFDFAKKVLILMFIRITGRKVVWTMHNRVPHDQKLMVLKRVILYLLIKLSSKIIIHSQLSRTILLESWPKLLSKIQYIPHPNYTDVYGSRLPNKESSSRLKLLFLGAVKPYKNIEMLIEIMSELRDLDIELLIVGKPDNDAYASHLLSMAKILPNVVTHMTFVSDAEIPLYLNNADLLIMPYDIKSSLNSGSALLAFSYARTVICPNIGTIDDISMKECMFSYEYQKPIHHKDILGKMIRNVYELKKTDKAILHIMGQRMLEYVEVHNSKELVVNKLNDVYHLI